LDKFGFGETSLTEHRFQEADFNRLTHTRECHDLAVRHFDIDVISLAMLAYSSGPLERRDYLPGTDVPQFWHDLQLPSRLSQGDQEPDAIKDTTNQEA